MESAQVEFLWKAISVMPQNNRSSDLLKCHLMSVCRRLDGKGDVHLPSKYTQKSTICQHCSNIWKNGKYTMRILPQRIPPKSVKKIISRYNKDPNCLRKYELGFVKKYAPQKNTLVITCEVCGKDTEIDVSKPKKKVVLECATPVTEPLSETRKKKKRYSRDPTAGLIIPPKGGSAHKNEQSMNSSFNTVQQCKSTPKINHSRESNDSPIMGEMTFTTMAKKNKRKLLKSDSEVTPVSRRKIPKKPEVPYQNNSLDKMIKHNKMGNILAKVGNSSESPLSKFLSSL